MAETTEAIELAPTSQMEEVGPCRLLLKIQVAADKIKEQLDKRYQDLSDSIALPGFRKGMAPRKLLERKFGKDVVENLRQEVVAHSFEKVVEERKLDVVGDPDLDIEKYEVKENEPFAFEVTVEIRPVFELKEYRKLKAVKPKVHVEDREVEAFVKSLHEAQGEYAAAEDGTARYNDQVIADFEFSCEGAVLQKSENVQLILNENIALYGIKVPAFHKSIVAMKVGNTVEFSVDIPKDFELGKYTGKEGWIKGKIKSIKRKNLPPLDDAWAKTMDVASLDEMKGEVRKRIVKMKEEKAEESMQDALVAQVVDQNDFTLPEGLVQKGQEEVLQRLRIDMLVRGMKSEEIDKDVDKRRGESREQIVRNLRMHFILEHIADKERVYVTEDEVENRIAEMASNYGKWPHEMKQYLEANDMLHQLRRQLREERTKKFLLEQAQIEEEQKP